MKKQLMVFEPGTTKSIKNVDLNTQPDPFSPLLNGTFLHFDPFLMGYVYFYRTFFSIFTPFECDIFKFSPLLNGTFLYFDPIFKWYIFEISNDYFQYALV